MPLSIVIITKNAASVIGESLRKIGGFVDDLIVVDSGSTDETIKVVKQFTNRIFVHPFKNDFSELRNYALSKARREWILVLDSDERLSEKAKNEIPNLLKSIKVDGYWCRRKTFISPNRYLRYGLFYPDYQLRLFRRKKDYCYKGRVHEQLTIPKSKTKKTTLDILHFPQHPKYDAFVSFRNMLPYIRLAAVMHQEKQQSALSLIWHGIISFFNLFFGGFFRGKGFRDGWAGFRAHLMFAGSVALGYLWASIIKMKGHS